MPSNLTATTLASAIRRREVSAVEVVRRSLAAIDHSQSRTNAFTMIDAEGALNQAAEADRRLACGRISGPLHGVPIAVKDNYLTYDLPTTAASRVLGGRHLLGEATVVSRLRQAGAIIIGKTNMHEWAYGATNEVSAYGPTRNPWNLEHITGGSSGGSGAAVAGGMVTIALGSDTGGSIRIPAAACGISGIKPTYGMLSADGLLPLSWSFDCAGPMARTAQDLAVALQVMAGVKRPEWIVRTFSGVRLGVIAGRGFECAADVAARVNDAIEAMVRDGALRSSVTIVDADHGFSMWKAIMFAEASAYHKTYLTEAPESYAPGVRSQLEAGRCIAAVDYIAAQQFRTVFVQQVKALLDSVDILVMPTLPVTAPRAGANCVTIAGRETSTQDAMTCMPWLANFTGLPAVSIPCGTGSSNLPVGLTLIGRTGSDFTLLDMAERFQVLTSWHDLRPEMQ